MHHPKSAPTNKKKSKSKKTEENKWKKNNASGARGEWTTNHGGCKNRGLGIGVIQKTHEWTYKFVIHWSTNIINSSSRNTRRHGRVTSKVGQTAGWSSCNAFLQQSSKVQPFPFVVFFVFLLHKLNNLLKKNVSNSHYKPPPVTKTNNNNNNNSINYCNNNTNIYRDYTAEQLAKDLQGMVLEDSSAVGALSTSTSFFFVFFLS